MKEVVSVKSQLIHMRDKLNNINKRNRSIRTLKLVQRWNFDLVIIDELNSPETAQGIVNKIVEQKTKGKITLVSQNTDDDFSLKQTKKLTDLYRQIKAREDETGVHDFYLGYPFVAGNLMDGTFIQAPLFLYPIRLEKDSMTKQKWILQLDEGGPQLNRTLFLAIKKLNKINFTEEFFEEATELGKDINIQEVIKFLAEYNLPLEYTSTGIKRLAEYTSTNVPSTEKLTVIENAIIGDFPQGGSAIVRDYDELIEISETNSLALVGEMIDPSKNNFVEEGVLPTDKEEPLDPVIEKEDVLNLLQTDGSQEVILRDARNKQGLVIQGPPGTGKSQVIVNLITDALYRKKKVLVVCQKRAALDVVYQRMHSLGLSDNVALIHDEKTDRKDLYKKINTQLVQYKNGFQEAAEELRNVSQRLSIKESTMNTIAKALYEKQPFGYKLYELYGIAKPVVGSNDVIKMYTVIDKINKDKLREVGDSVLTYGEWYAQYGNADYPLKNRKNLSDCTLDQKIQTIETLEGIIKKAKDAVEYMENLQKENITPEYLWGVAQTLEKIYPDISGTKKRTLQNFRIFWWTNFSGKSIMQELLNGEKFNGINSTEWVKIKQSLVIMHDLGNITKDISASVSSLNHLISGAELKEYQSRIAIGDIPLEELESVLAVFQSDYEDLKLMDSYWESSNEVTKKVLDLLMSKDFNTDEPLPIHWKEVFFNSTYNYWIELIESKYKDINMISSNDFERFRKEFATLIEEQRDAAAKYLMNNLAQNVNAIQELKPTLELKHQTGKKRQIWPVRKLVNEFASKGLVDILPVWLASPEMVSSMFPLKEGLFDLVIFDEASQMTVETGMPAVYRGKQVIVAGDEMQLQPSTMFRAGYADEDDEEEYDTDESISLLNLAKRRFESRTLQWHYRSKYEELINFSNHAFYNGYIQIAPNVTPFKNPPAIQWKNVNGRWINQSNEVEAIEVVSILKEMLQTFPDKTFGIITFNAKQQSKVQDMIDKHVTDDAEFSVLYNDLMARSLDERLFVKNIENVQGDERDIIIFSIGYAKNEEGKVYNRFGSLNQSGGENRLNVAVTRAKEGIVIVSSIEPEELNVASTAERGPKLLKEYLKYARAVSNGRVEEINAVVQEINETVNTHVVQQALHFDSPFEEQVYEALRKLGYEVVTQVGMSGYRIDMAVVDPNDSSRYILGIECDGAMYHSSPSARERDVYRQKYLESRGWKIERIWSRNWWKNPHKEIERIDGVIKEFVRERM